LTDLPKVGRFTELSHGRAFFEAYRTSPVCFVQNTRQLGVSAMHLRHRTPVYSARTFQNCDRHMLNPMNFQARVAAHDANHDGALGNVP
jgi:hypothetical protein